MSKRKLKIQTVSVYISTTLVLMLLGTMGLLLVVAESLSDYVRKELTVSVVMSKSVSESDAVALQKRLEAKEYCKQAVYVSSSETLEKEAVKLGIDAKETVEFLGYNPYRASIELSMKPEFADNTRIAKIEKELKAYKGVEEIVYPREIIDTVNSNIHRIGLGLLVFFALLMMVSWSLVSNMVRLSIYSKRFLLHTMKLVGATWGFIRRPFLVRNMWIGLASGIMADALLSGALYVLCEKEPGFVSLLPPMRLVVLGGGIILFGMLATVFCAYISVNRFLRMRGNDLYFI